MRLAVVTPWFGSDLLGGAERTAWQVAHGLAARGHEIAVFTTTVRAFSDDWTSGTLPEGTSADGAVTIHRFPVDPRDGIEFTRANALLVAHAAALTSLSATALDGEAARSFVAHGINSRAAITALGEQLDAYDAVLVLPYPYGLCIAAVAAAGGKALLQPCLHDEPYAYLHPVERAMRTAGGLLFNTNAEADLAIRLFGPAIGRGATVTGQWVDAPVPAEPQSARIRGFVPSEHRYVLYVGRRDATKNIDVLVESFATFRRLARLSTLELVLVGAGARSYANERHGIRDLGPVSDAQRDVLLADALALAQPSENESYSRTIVEAWMAGIPVLANGRCAPTAEAVTAAGGGWTAVSKAEWTNLFERVDLTSAQERAALGEAGRRFVAERGSRDAVLERYEDAVRGLAQRHTADSYAVAPLGALLDRLREGPPNILYSGPLSEAACIDQVLASFAFLLAMGIDARLILQGAADDARVEERLFDTIAAAHLGDRVLMMPPEPRAVTVACYRAARIFWTTSEDGDERGLLDALAYGVPIVAYASTTACAVLADSGLQFTEKADLNAVAGIAALLMSDPALRATVVAGQRRRYTELQRSAAAAGT